MASLDTLRLLTLQLVAEKRHSLSDRRGCVEGWWSNSKYNIKFFKQQ
jgi:hypothetical protein